MNTDATYFISMFSHYYAQTIPNVNAGFIRGYIRKDIWVSLQGAYIRGAYLRDFTLYQEQLIDAIVAITMD